MVEQYWGLKEAPFSLTPNPKYQYLSRKHEDMFMMLHYAVNRKWLELLELVEHLVGLIANSTFSSMQMVKEVMYQFGIKTKSRALINGAQSVFTCREAARYLRMPMSSHQNLVEKGNAPGIKVEDKWRFSKAALDEWMAQQARQFQIQNNSGSEEKNAD